APWSNMFMTTDSLVRDQREGLAQLTSQTNEGSILCIRVGNVITTFQLDTHTIVVAVSNALKLRSPRMPGAIGDRHKLAALTIARDIEARRDLQVGNLGVIGMDTGSQAVTKKIGNRAITELARRQAGVVDNQEAHLGARRALVEIWRWNSGRSCQPATGIHTPLVKSH